MALVSKFALPFLEAHTSLESGLQATRDGLSFYANFTLPVFEFLLGDAETAIRDLQALIAAQDGASGVWPDHVRSVSTKLLEQMQ